VPASMQIISADDIRRSGARDIPGVLRHVGGVDILQWTGDHADVGIRGYAEVYTHRVLVLVDGRQVYADHYGYTPWVAIPVELSAIRQIEIVKGPASALFGFNAVDGVINIVTYSPLHDDVNVASVSGGTQSLVQGSAVSTFKVGDVGVRLMAGGFRDHDFTTPVPPTMILEPRFSGTRGSFDIDAVWKASDKVHLELSANYIRTRADEMDGGYFTEPARYKNYSVRGRVTADLGAAGLLQLGGYANWFDSAYIPDPVFGLFSFSNPLFVLQAQDIFKLGNNHTFRLSAEYGKPKSRRLLSWAQLLPAPRCQPEECGNGKLRRRLRSQMPFAWII
jgi:outer membrane receptor for ferrienterochelin and colicins